MVPHTLVVLLLDWAEPWMWVRQLRDWVLFLKEVVSSLDEETRDIMELYMKEWQQRRRGGAHDAGGSGMNDAGVELPLSSGEWDESLGLPICVVCHSVNNSSSREKGAEADDSLSRLTKSKLWKRSTGGVKNDSILCCNFCGLFS